MTVNLGLTAFHPDSAACLVIDGQLVGAVAEERLGPRIKHSAAFPANAIRWLLADAGLRLRDVTHVAIALNPKANFAAKMGYVARYPMKAAGAVIEHVRRNRHTQSIVNRLAEVCDEDPTDLRLKLVNVKHHLAHIASAYFLSPFEGVAAALSYDASGDFASLMAARCEGNRIEVLGPVTLPDSLGFFYTALCQFIGFDRFGEEYKVMCLAAYGENRYSDQMAELLQLVPNGWFRLGRRYFGMHESGTSFTTDELGNVLTGRLYTDSLSRLFCPPSSRNAPLTQR